MTIDKIVMDMKVIGKQKGTKGFIFKSPKYTIALQVVDSRTKTHPTMEREVSFHQYSAMNIGAICKVTMYTPNGHTWYFSRDEAELMS